MNIFDLDKICTDHQDTFKVTSQWPLLFYSVALILIDPAGLLNFTHMRLILIFVF